MNVAWESLWLPRLLIAVAPRPSLWRSAIENGSEITLQWEQVLGGRRGKLLDFTSFHKLQGVNCDLCETEFPSSELAGQSPPVGSAVCQCAVGTGVEDGAVDC